MTGDTATRATASLSWSLGEPIVAEPAGRAYWAHLLRARTVDARKLTNVSALSIADDGGDEDDERGVDFNLRTDLTPAIVSSLTYYELLGFDLYGTGVKDEALKRAYRKAVLTYHPDKTGSSRGEEDEVFMAVQRAFETLSDPVKRKQYDSSLEFDDAVPEEGVGAHDPAAFFAAYGPVFERNERFAVLLPAPKLGDDETPIEEVNKFYEYWVNFESWRDFAIEAAEHDLEDAEDRYHKRWMQKENDKRNRELKRKEYRRLSTLVDRARATDPRIRRAREQERKAKRDAKEAKVAAAAAAVAEAAEAAAAAAAEVREIEERRKEEARAARSERERRKKELKRLRKTLRVLLTPASAGGPGEDGVEKAIPSEELDFLWEQADAETLTLCVEALGGAQGPWRSEGIATVRGLTQRVQTEADEARADEAAAREAELERLRAAERRVDEERKQRLRPWSEEEMSCLAKAVVRFPAGAQNRWEHVSAFLSQQLRLSEPRAKDECIAKYQELHAAPAQAKDKAMRRTAAPAAAAAAVVAPLSSPTAPAAASDQADASAAAGGTRKKVASAPVAAVAPVSAGAAAATAAAAPAAGQENGSEEAGDAWSQVQQRQLEEALAKYPASLEKNERWKSISAAVEGKTKKQCVERFKQIKALLQANSKSS